MLVAGALLSMFAVALLAAVLIWPPADFVREQLITEVERQTGRKLTMTGTRLDFGRGLAVSLSGVALSGPPAMGTAPLLTAARLDVELALLPLIVREVHIQRLTLVNPVLDLKIDASGRRNWDFAAAEQAPLGPVRFAQAPGRLNDAARLPSEARDFLKNANSPPATGRSGSATVEQVSLGDVRIVGGRVNYQDSRHGTAHALEKVDGHLSLPSPGGRLSLSGSATREGERVEIDGWIEPLRELLAERPVTVSLKLKGAPGELAYDGRLVASQTPAGEGRLSIKGGSPSTLARLAGLPITGLDAVQGLGIEGGIQVNGATYTLQNGQFALGASRGTGSLTVETAGAKPRVTTSLRFATLDLDQLARIDVGRASEASPPSQPPENTPGRFTPRRGVPPTSIDDLLRGPVDQPAAPELKGPQVRGFRQRLANAWDVEAIDAGPLRLFDLDARIHIAELKSAGLDARRLQVAVELKDAVLKTNVTEAELGGGKLRGLVSIDARQKELTVGANLSGEGVALEPLLKALEIEPLEGRGRWVVAVSSRGSSERDLVSGLAGRAELKVVDGAVLGWDADAMIAGLAQGRIPSPQRQPGAKTPFKELSGSFQIAQGVARTRDLKLDSATLASSGTGTVNIVDRNIDLMIKPRLTSGGLEVPVRIAGPWDAPNAVADVNAALKSPQAQEAVRQLKDGNVDGALRSVLGNSPKADKQIERAKDFLKGFLKN